MSVQDNASGFDNLGKLAASAGGAAAGGVFAWRLFADVGVEQLLAAGTVYGLTVLCIVGAIVMVAGYAILPQPSVPAVTTTLRAAIAALFVCGFAGMGYQIWFDHADPPVGIRVVFRPILQDLNTSRHLAKDYELSADLTPPQGEDMSLVAGRLPQRVFMRNNQEITINMDSLFHLVDQLEVNKGAAGVCGNGGCPTAPSSAPNSRANPDTGLGLLSPRS